MPVYKITLQPPGHFFFGGEIKFNDASLDERRATYITHSRYFPQQTALLGMLRLELLLQNGLLRNTADRISDKARADQLIGPKGFSANGHDASIGVIESLSPVFILGKTGESWLPAPLDDQPAGAENLVFSMAQDGHAFFKHYDPKSELKPKFARAGTDSSSYPLETFYHQDERIGITKTTKPWFKSDSTEDTATEDDADGFFKQSSLRFSQKGPGAGFAFFVKLKESDFELNDAMVVLGGERSVFNMRVEEEGFSDKDLALPGIGYRHTTVEGEGIGRLVLLSDALADPNEIKKHSLLTVSRTISFRFLSAGPNTRFFHALNPEGKPNGDGLQSSKLYHLIERGSVIYFKKEHQAALEQVFERPDFFQIGYNHFQIL